MKESQYFRMSYENDIATLKIVEVFIEDGGEYICAAMNEAGNAQTSCDIIVKGKKWKTNEMEYFRIKRETRGTVKLSTSRFYSIKLSNLYF